MKWNMSGVLFCLGLFLPAHCLGDDRQVASRPLGIVQQLDQHGQLWSDDIAKPRLETISFPDAIKHVRVEPSTGDKFTFLHDPVIAWHQNSLFAAWYNCPRLEIVDESLIRGRRSFDNGVSWSAPEVVASDRSNTGVHYVPAQLLSYQGTFHAFVGKMTGHDLITACACYTLDERLNEWTLRGEIASRFLPNCQPLKLDNGNWIMAGRVSAELGKKPMIPAVAISSGDRLTAQWNVVPLQSEELTSDQCPETTVWVDGAELVAIVRNNADSHPFLFVSVDFGETWKPRENHNFQSTTSKLYAGRLSTGQYFVVFNWPQEGDRGIHNRAVLAIAVSRPGEFAFSKAWRVQDRSTPDRPIASHYPCVIEHDQHLYIVYTASVVGRRACELATIPVSSLRTASNP